MRKSLWLGILVGAIALVAALGFHRLYARFAHEEPPLCDICRRPIMPRTAFSVLADGHTVWYCCPRCWLSSQRVREGKFHQPVATDYASGKRIAAQKCVYLEGSDVTPCCSPNMTRGKDGMPAVECYDRCFPSTLAFASAEEALRFSKEHGGTIVPSQTLADEAKKP